MDRRGRPSDARETVVLLHGMGRTRASMWPMLWRLKRAGYDVHNFPYAPPLTSLADISRSLVRYISERAEGGAYHLVGHSLGNIIVRHALGVGLPPGLGRIVMLAPPNQPPALARAFRDNALYRVWMGDAGQQLASEDFYRELPVPEVPFGVIAGDRAHTPVHDEPSDGVVTVRNTRLGGMADFAVVHHTHTFLMNASDTFELCLRFLQTGAFAAGAAGEAGFISS